jgi:TPR repeat protein
MMAWSVKPGQAYLSRDGIRQIKSKLTNDIFKQEVLQVYEQKSQSRDELVREARQAMLGLTQKMKQGICDHPEAEQLIMELAQELEAVKGKKSYGYLPKKLKSLVDDIVDQMERLPVVSDCYGRWLVLQGQVQSYYTGEEPKRLKLSQQKEFRAIKNAVIREAERVRLGEITFEDVDMDLDDTLENENYASAGYWALKELILDETESLEKRDSAVERIKQIAQDGDPHAQYFLGKLYRDGGLLVPDSQLATDWFNKAARQNLVAAQYALGKLLLSDDNDVRDTRLGMEWLEYAAKNGSRCAAYCAGKEYLRGKSVKKDVPKAVEYFESAARAGNPYAQYMLGKLYLAGSVTKRDIPMAEYWFSQSAQQGNQYAQFLLDRMGSLKPTSVMLSTTRLLRHMANIFRDNSLPKTGPVGMRIDRKRLQKLREKKIAMGHKPDDHEEYTGPTLSM